MKRQLSRTSRPIMMTTRRDFLTTVGACTVGAASPSVFGALYAQSPTAATGAMRFACHTMTWGDDYVRGIEDIAKAGFHGVQLRPNVLTRFGEKPADLQALLAQQHVEFVCFSGGTLLLAPEREAETLAQLEKHAQFVQAAGGLHMQVTDERPKDREPTPDDRKRMGGLLTTLGRRCQPLGVKLVYHNHMGNLGQRPEEVAEVLAASDPAVVGLLLDVAHYAQAGGDPAAAVRAHKDRLVLVHAKDVRTVPRPAAAPANAPSYQFVELGRGRVDLPGAFTALKGVGYRGWVIVELDAVPDPGGSATASMLASKQYIEQVLKLPL
jgi:inosose dehydratase